MVNIHTRKSCLGSTDLGAENQDCLKSVTMSLA
jgi:hypothetical protein